MTTIPHTLRMAASAAIFGLGLAACSGGGATTAAKTAVPASPTGHASMPMDVPAVAAPLTGPAVSTDAVTINNFAFSPKIITVKVGQTVTWTNMDEEPHTVTDGDDGIHSPVLGNQGSTFSYTFTKAGSYGYNCSIHPFMHGMVEVTA
jgi:plastocyanin